MSIDGKITPRQIAWLVVTIRTSVIMVSIASLGAGIGRDAWISELVVTVGIMVIMAWVMVTLCLRFPRKSLIEIGEAILGKYLGKLLGLAILWFFLFVTASLVREVGEFLTTVFFPETPIIVFILLFTAVLAYGVRMGLETIVRMNDLIFLMVVAIFVILWVLVIKDAKFENLLPVYQESGLKVILQGGIIASAGFMLVVAIGMIFPYINQQQRAFKMIVLGLIIKGIIIAVTVILIISVFGIKQAELFDFQGMALARVISVAGFLERIDAIFMAVWVVGTFIKTGLFYYCFVLGTGQLLRLEAVNFLVVPTGALIIALAMVSYHSYVNLLSFFYSGWVIHNWVFLFFVPLGLLLLAVILRKKES